MAEIQIHNAAEIDATGWRQLQAISRAAFASTLDNRSQEEVDALVGWDDPDRYYSSHVDPNFGAERRCNPDQRFYNPRVAIATVACEYVGFAYSIDTSSVASGIKDPVSNL